MSIDFLFFILLFSFIFFVILTFLSNTKHPYRTALKSGGSGVLSLVLVQITTTLTGLSLGINFFTGAVGVVLGVPGVLCLLLMKVVLGG